MIRLLVRRESQLHLRENPAESAFLSDALDPDWIPPQVSSRRGESLWVPFGSCKLDEIRTGIEQIQARLPNWRPSSEFASNTSSPRRDGIVHVSDSGNRARFSVSRRSIRR